MKRIAFCCLWACILIFSNTAYSQVCTPDPGCTPAQLICPPALPSGCEGEAYSQTITLSLGGTIMGFPLTSITVNNLTGLPPGLTFACAPQNCVFNANTSGCILISGIPTTPGTYPIQGNLLVNVGITVPIDTAVGSITITSADCAGVCGGTASIDNCGICSGGTTGVLPNCDDGDACTNDACDGAGGCLNTPLDCDDGDACTSDVCNGGACNHFPVNCTDADACNGIETCDTVLGCVPGTPLVCDDGDACNGVETCDPLLGCQAGTPLDCDDANACTSDTCFGGACANFPVNCTDADACNGIETCDTLIGCVPGTPLDCDDGDSCTIDSCHPLLGCSNDPDPLCGDPCDTLNCDDANACTSDTCFGGACANFPVNCTDADACNGIETCDTLLGCLTGTPLICDDGDACNGVETCHPLLGCQAGTPLDCDDANACTSDTCFNNGCANFPVNCTDADACNGIETCDTILGCLTGTPLVCDDADACTNDSCHPLLGCEFTPIPGCGSPCDSTAPVLDFSFDQVACPGDTVTLTNNSTGVDAAASLHIDQDGDGVIDMTFPAAAFPVGSSQGVPVPADVNLTIIAENPDGCADTFVVSIQALVCDDGDSCTTDACDNGACVNTPIPGCAGDSCDVNGPQLDFAVQSACAGDTGVITNNSTNIDPAGSYQIDQDGDGVFDLTFPTTAFPVGTSQDIALPGDVTLTIVVVNSDGCTDTAVVSITAVVCDDGDSCTTDACDNGVCTFTPSCCVSNADCDDSDACTTDSCNGGACIYTQVCDDNYTCTQDICTNGVCSYLAICCIVDADCDDSDACTIDNCVSNICVRIPNGCDDSDACTTDSCDNGNCLNTALNCDDGDSCTTDICDNGICLHTAVCCAVNADCDDGDACTVDSCGGGLCVFAALNCDDGDSCTVDVCNNGVCENSGSCCASTADCLDGDLCTLDQCINGICFSFPRCDDGDGCTNDYCFTGYYGLRCRYKPVDCSDGDKCTIDQCVNGSCVNTPKNCDDGDSCTTDFCDDGDCRHTQLCCTDDSDCADGDPCTVDTCGNAVCANTPKDCDDNDVCTDDACDRGWHYYYGDDDDDNGWGWHGGGGHDDDDDDGGWDDDDDGGNDDDDDGNLPPGTCVHRPVDCRDGDVCTTDFCDTLNGCTNDSIAGCCTADTQCDDGDICTTDKCYNNACTYFTTGGTVRIEALSDLCQDGGVVLRARGPAGSAYVWSTGETTTSIRGAAGLTYSVTATNTNGCSSVDSFTVTSSERLISSYVIIANKKVRLSGNTVFEGGVGAMSSGGYVSLKNNTQVTAAGTFVRANNIQVSSSSAATTQYASPANIQLPAFQDNPYFGGPDVNIAPGSTATLGGSVYDDVTIGSNSVVTFTQTDLYFDNLYTKNNVTLKFAPCTRIHINDKLRLGNGAIFNPDENDVVVYVEDYVEIYSSSTVTADIYVRDGSLNVHASSASAPTVMKGLFIAQNVEARENTHWYVNATCDPGCAGTLQPLIVMKNDEPESSAAPAEVEMQPVSETLLKAYPNPFVETLNIEFSVATDSRVRLEVFNLSGQQIATVFEGFVTAGEQRKVEFRPVSDLSGMVIYRLQTDHGIFFGKAIMAK